MNRLLSFLLLTVCVLASCESTQHRSRKAIDDEIEVRSERQKKSLTEYHEGMRLYEEDEFVKAIEQFQKSTRTNPRHIDAWLALGVTEFELDHFPEAVSAFIQAGEISPMRFEPHYNLGSIYEAVGRYENAISSYEKALELAPGQLEVMENLARCYMLTSQKSDVALKYIRRALLIEHRPQWRAWLESQEKQLIGQSGS